VKEKQMKNNLSKQTLFQMVKDTQNYSNKGEHKSVVAFCDNASALSGYNIDTIIPDMDTGEFRPKNRLYHHVLTAETHNSPTGVAPFPGAATGTGGRIRDNQAIGRGGLVVAGIVGYCVGEVDPDKSRFWKKNLKTLLRGSDGCSDYGNKFGEPVILGFCRTFGKTINDQRMEYRKPILFSGGIGQVDDRWIHKKEPEVGNLVVKIGGPAYKIGIGGSSMSSRGQDSSNFEKDLQSIQRGDPEVENRLNRVIRACAELDDNPIKSAHDQGASGNAAVLSEIIYPTGAKIDMDRILTGDKSMSALELWVSEYQENNAILTDRKGIHTIDKICKRENLPYSVVGHITGTGKIEAYHKGKSVVNLPLDKVLGKMPQKQYEITKTVVPKSTDEPSTQTSSYNINIHEALKRVLQQPTVGSKRFLTNKVDRSVTGLIAQQQCVGPLHTPLSDYGITAQSHFSRTGCATSVGEQPIKGLLDPGKMARLTVGEMLTNMVFAKITALEDIRCSGNWMWPLNSNSNNNGKDSIEGYRMYKACKEMCLAMNQLSICADGGKDSLSMTYKDCKTGETTKSPGSLVITGYAPMDDITKKVTPDFKYGGNVILLISPNKETRMGGSSLMHALDLNEFYSNSPDVDVPTLGTIFRKMQYALSQNLILSGHDRSDGGLLTTLCEMSFASNIGFQIALGDKSLGDKSLVPYLFNEEIGLVVECEPECVLRMGDLFGEHMTILGKTVCKNSLTIKYNDQLVLNSSITVMRGHWEKPSYQFELEQCNKDCAKSEYKTYLNYFDPEIYPVNQTFLHKLRYPTTLSTKRKYSVGIIRDEGSNGDREMASAFYAAGFKVYDVNMEDLISGKIHLDQFNGLAFVGGFSYSDVCGAATGWYNVITTNPTIKQQFTDFYNKKDTFSLGVCNGCQLMVKLGWISSNVRLEQNTSGRFESRFPNVVVNKTKSIMLHGLEKTTTGIWSAHGEGKFTFDGPINTNSIALQYTDLQGDPTMEYPYNPNGSSFSAAAVCSNDGRHLAIMPHPERCFLRWQLPHDDVRSKVDDNYTVWFQMFLNSYRWLEEH
jgi:phosphoribosylformylglycinamidine synthase